MTAIAAESMRLAACLTALMLLAACSIAPNPGPAATKGSTLDATESCTGTGQYKVIPSAVGPFPGLAQSAVGDAYTPRIGLVGTKVEAAVPTVSLMMWADEPEPSKDETSKDLVLGDELTFRGYTLKITSTCADSAQFDLMSLVE